MAEIKNVEAYFATIVRNSYKDEYRANDSYYDHISSVGDIVDVQQHADSNVSHGYMGTCAVEVSLCEDGLDNWLLFMENERLHKALTRLLPAQVAFLYELAAFDFDRTEYAVAKGVSKQAVSDRFRRISKKIKKYF